MDDLAVVIEDQGLHPVATIPGADRAPGALTQEHFGQGARP
ncbi:hypothetical protein ACIBCM_06375 [Streptomyces sp. NPDC051018]